MIDPTWSSFPSSFEPLISRKKGQQEKAATNHTHLIVYQKVVPAPIFTLLLELTSLAPTPSSGPGIGSGSGAGAPAQRVEASVADIDDSSPVGSAQSLGGGSGSGSGGDWEKLSEEGARV